jgi:hypothetical protein
VKHNTQVTFLFIKEDNSLIYCGLIHFPGETEVAYPKAYTKSTALSGPKTISPASLRANQMQITSTSSPAPLTEHIPDHLH